MQGTVALARAPSVGGFNPCQKPNFGSSSFHDRVYMRRKGEIFPKLLKGLRRELFRKFHKYPMSVRLENDYKLIKIWVRKARYLEIRRFLVRTVSSTPSPPR